ncbi:DUF1961 family protein [Polaribacter vadi]|uniref:DUF1961 family protein n=1 Tax=Polaribacter vadi TaxID=1774273 RepID=UPI0030EC9248|tara:strand:+ start:66821 stop:67630 length:810 start_codon:yes stop_codon:yes gene_type:complete
MNYIKKTLFFKVLIILGLLLSFSCSQKVQVEFNQQNKSTEWKLEFSDSCKENWQDKWFLDGEIAKVEYNEFGMDLIAGPINRNNAHHSVLWTKQSFEGDIKIEFDYTRTDSTMVNVNILFIQATGNGKGIFDKDISNWNDFRKVPTMSKYYNNMKTIHISFAAFPMVNEDPENDYLRVRRYPVTEDITFKDMEVAPSYFKTGLFKTGVTYKMTWIKSGDKLYLSVKDNSKTKWYSWDLSRFEQIKEGRIGLRHMFTRSASYNNFNVWTK